MGKSANASLLARNVMLEVIVKPRFNLRPDKISFKLFIIQILHTVYFRNGLFAKEFLWRSRM